MASECCDCLCLVFRLVTMGNDTQCLIEMHTFHAIRQSCVFSPPTHAHRTECVCVCLDCELWAFLECQPSLLFNYNLQYTIYTWFFIEVWVSLFAIAVCCRMAHYYNNVSHSISTTNCSPVCAGVRPLPYQRLPVMNILHAMNVFSITTTVHFLDKPLLQHSQRWWVQ